MEEKDCIFCKISRGEIDSKKVYDDENFFAISDAKPKMEGHTLIISKNHYENMLDMPASLGNELLDMVKKISVKLIDTKKGEGVNVISKKNIDLMKTSLVFLLLQRIL